LENGKMAVLNIIAEAAQGYEGKPEFASLLVMAAARAKADGVKFQAVYADELATPDYPHYELFKSLEMPDESWMGVRKLADRIGVTLYLDIFGNRSLELAQKLSCPGVKIHSTDMANLGLLQAVAGSSVPLVLLSTAGCSDAEIGEVLRLFDRKNVVLLHGFQGYPTPVEANHVARIPRLQQLLDKSGRRLRSMVGFADHAPADDPIRFLLPAAALGAGALVFEKHLTLSRIMKFEDHEAALSPDEFADFVVQMRACFSALGTDAAMHASELAYRRNTRKHVVAARNIAPGETVVPDMIALLRTSSTEPVYDARSVYGRRAKTNIGTGSAISESLLEK
jgi:N,N'-diacetyllegionaminate synthase